MKNEYLLTKQEVVRMLTVSGILAGMKEMESLENISAVKFFTSQLAELFGSEVFLDMAKESLVISIELQEMLDK